MATMDRRSTDGGWGHGPPSGRANGSAARGGQQRQPTQSWLPVKGVLGVEAGTSFIQGHLSRGLTMALPRTIGFSSAPGPA